MNATFHTKIVAFFFPLVGLYLGLINFRTKYYRSLLYIVAFVFGYTFVANNDALDSFRNIEYFYSVSKLNWNEFYKSYFTLFSSEQTLDLAKPTLAFLASRLSQNHRFFYGIISVIFTYFQVNSTLLVLGKNIIKPTKQVLMLIIIFSIINPIVNINGFRFYTAVWIYFSAVLQRTSRLRVGILMIFACLFHVSFLAPVVVYYLYRIIKPGMAFIILIFLASLYVRYALDVTWFLSGIDLFQGPQAFSDHALRYVDKADTISSGNATHMLGILSNIMYLFIIVLGYTKLISFNTYSSLTQERKDLFGWSIWFFSFSILASSISSGARFFTVAYLIAFAFLIKVAIENNWHYRKLGYLIPAIGIVLCCALPLRLLLDELNPLIVFFSPLAVIFADFNLTPLIFG